MKKNFINGIIEIANIEIRMTPAQYKMYSTGEMNLLEIKLINQLDEEVGNIFKFDKKMYKYIVIGIATMLTIISVSIPVYADSFSQIDVLGNKFLSVIRVAMYWICLIKGLIEVGREVSAGGDNLGGIAKTIVKYVLAFATIYILPSLFDSVKEVFAGV